jgi:HAD superfamily phosphoserine phosphatase-like hydrolase
MKAMKTRKQKVAVFDVDGTIFRSSLFIELVEDLIRKGRLPPSMRRTYEREEKKWINREGEYDAYVNAMVRASHVYFRGISLTDFKSSARDVIRTQSKHVYRYTRDLLKDLRKKGYFLLAVSHSPKIILDYFCPTWGFHKWYGILYEADNKERLTSSVVDEHVILNKANILKRAVTNQNLTLNGSVGVGDSESDAAFLALVEKPICFNPSSDLYRIARKRKWRIVVERKDVIYEL